MPRLGAILTLLLTFLCLPTPAQTQRLTVTGTLSRVMAIGGESTGWSIAFDTETTIDGQPLHSIQVSSPDKIRLEALANKHVRATGQLTHHHGVETGDQPVLTLRSIREAPAKAATLTGTEWRLDDLAGTPAIPDSHATLTFPEPAKVAGNASCNRFTGSAQITGATIHLGPLGATRMMCPEPAMTQETNYLAALNTAERFELHDTHLLLYSKGLEKPLRFTRLATPAQTPSAP